MKELSKEELEKVLIEVRKSYRLLYFYQRRIIDTVSFIANVLSRRIETGRSLFNENPNRNDHNFDNERWAWDWLNMYDYEFYLGSLEVPPHKYMLAIAVQADSGYYDGGNITETEVEKFALVEDSVSKIYFMLGKDTWKPDRYEECWDKKAKDEYTASEGRFIVKRFDLSDFNSEENIINQINLFKKFCIEKGMPDFVKQIEL